MTGQAFTNRHGDEMHVEHHTDQEVPSVELRFAEDAIYLEPDVALRLALALVPIAVIGPDDHLVLKLDTSADLATMEQFRESLQAWAPGLAGRVLIIGGAAEAFVVRPGDEVPR